MKKVGTNPKNSRNKWYIYEYLDFPIESAPVLLFCHVLGGTKESFEQVIKNLTRSYRIISIDLRGHGCSSKTGPFSIQQLADDIHALINFEKIQKVTIVGASISSTIAVMFASQYPELVEKLVLIDGGYCVLEDMPEFDVDAIIQNTQIYFQPHTHEELVKSVKKSFGHFFSEIVETAEMYAWKQISHDTYQSRLTYEAWEEFFRESCTIRLDNDYQHINCPVLLVQKDPDLPVYTKERSDFYHKAASEFQKRVQTARVITLRNSHHQMMLTNPQELAYLIDDYLKGFSM